MDRLVHGHELLDGPLDDEAALAGNLRDLARINRWLGGVALSRRALEALVLRASANGPPAAIDILDVGTGGADIPAALVDRGVLGSPVRATGIDVRPEVVVAARRRIGNRPIDLRVGDGRSLPFGDGAFDVVHASLVLHHLDEPDGIALLAEMSRVGRLGVVVNDLGRARIHWLGAWLIGHLLTTNRLTRADAPMSVRRAWTRREMLGLLDRAGLQPVAEAGGLLGHRYAIAAVRR
jgi:ubiquinone/menaquinone biosynthesis C-methylase UbiE